MASSKRPVRANDLFRLACPLEVALSPDGEQVVYVRRRMNLVQNRYEANLWLMPVRGGKPRQLTRTAARHLHPTWHPRGRYLAYVRQREGQPPQIWILPMQGGEPWQLTSLEGGPVRQLRWSPDGRWILFNHREQPRLSDENKRRRPAYKHITELYHKLDGDGFFPAARWHLYRTSFPAGRTAQLTRGDHNNTQGVWSPDGKRIAFISNRIPEADYHVDNNDLFVMSAAGRGPRQVTRRFGPVDTPAWSLDGKALYYVGHFGRDGEWIRHRHHIYRIPISGGRPRDLTPKLDNWPFNHVATDTVPSGAGYLFPYLEPGGRDRERVAFLVNEEGACRVYSVAGTGGKHRLEMGGRINAFAAGCSAKHGRAVIAASRMLDGGDLYSLSLDGSADAVRLTELNRRQMDRWSVREPEEVIFGGRRNKGVPVHGWILKPPGFRKNGRYPLILNIHGGPMAQYGYSFFHEMHLLAAQGYVVVYTNPRGSSGYGLRFMNCIENRWGQDDYADLMTVVDQMVRKPYVDGRRLGVLGGSYGGFMTTWMVGHTHRFRAAVTQRQVGNVMTQAGSSDLGFYRVYSRGSLPWETPMKYLKDSPNFYADKIKTPLLIIHSENDLRCPIAQGEELFTLLKLRRRTVEMVRFEGESHGLSRGGRPQNRLERLNRITGWFRRYL